MNQLQEMSVSVWGGLNLNDQSTKLPLLSHEGGFGQQIAPLEAVSLLNVDFEKELRKRKGCTTYADLTSAGLNVLLSGDVLVNACDYVSPVTGTRYQIIVSKKTIYYDTGGTSFAQINNQSGSAYTHSDQSVTMASFAIVDGHLVIGLDGANYIQLFRTGTELDDQLHNDASTTTVDADSAAGQKVLNAASTTGFVINDRVLINSGGARQEHGYVTSIQAGVSITLRANLTYEHTAAQADVVDVQNLYTEALGGTTHVVDSTWNTGSYLVAEIHGRLVYCTGNTNLQYSTVPSSTTGLWKGSEHGTYIATGRVVALWTFVPQHGDALASILYIFSDNGVQFVTGFTASDSVFRIEGSGVPLNYKTVAASKNWVIYPTKNHRLEGVHGSVVIDLGRKLRRSDGTGPLESMNDSQTDTVPCAFYNSEKEQYQLWLPTGSSTTNNYTVVLDFQLGEPLITESQPTYDPTVRPLLWDGTDFICVFRKRNRVLGVRSGGTVWRLENGNDDYGSTAIESYWESPDFTMGLPAKSKLFLYHALRGTPSGDYNLTVDYYIDRGTGSSRTVVHNQGGAQAAWDSGVWDTALWATGVALKENDDTDLYAESIRFRLRQDVAGATWRLSESVMRYAIGAEER